MKELASIILFFTTVSAFAQGSATDSLLKKFRDYRAHHLQEKVYLHIDNGFYIAGEQIYLSAYVVDASFHKPLTLSNVVYVEVLGQANKVIAQEKVEMKQGRGSGVIHIPPSCESGTYVIRAYTHWMKNFSTDFFFHQQISVVNTFKQLEPAKVSNEKEMLVNFFPEGGNLIADMDTKVAFKITDGQGHGFAMNGFVTERNGRDTIVKFSPRRFGLGSFVIKPAPAKEYTAHLVDGNGKTQSYDLPAVNQSGYRMKVTETEALVRVDVAYTNPLQSSPEVYLFVHARNIIARVEQKLLTGGNVVFELDKSAMQEGISHLTIFDAQLQPQCQRLFFKPVTNLLSITMDHKSSVKSREKFDLNIQTRNENGNALQANFSIAVYRLDSLAVVNREGIAEYVWLTSDLKGLIEDPSYYLNDNTDSDTRDLLMLTHGWSRFKWEELTSLPPTVEYLPEYSGHLISGIVKKSNGDPGNSKLTWLSSPDKTVRTHATLVDTKGVIQFQTYGLYGTRRLIIQPSDPGEDFNFTLTNPFSTSFSTISNRGLNVSRKNRSTLLQRSIAVQARSLYERELVSKIKTPPDTIPFYGTPDERYNLDDYTRFPNIEEVMIEYVAGVRVRKRKDGFHFIVSNEINRDVSVDDPLILLDGVPVSAARILEYNALNVQRLDVVSRRYFVSAASVPGIVSFVTYKGDFNQMQTDPSTFQINYDGLQQHTEYFTPIYETEKQKRSPVPDLRYLQYWNSHAPTNSNGIYSTSFYTSDVKGKYVIVVEGISNDGKVGRAVGNFEIVD